MSAAVEAFLENESRRIAAGEVAASRAAEYDVSRIAPRLLAVIEGTIRGKVDRA
jgi:hypothetical protein